MEGTRSVGVFGKNGAPDLELTPKENRGRDGFIEMEDATEQVPRDIAPVQLGAAVRRALEHARAEAVKRPRRVERYAKVHLREGKLIVFCTSWLGERWPVNDRFRILDGGADVEAVGRAVLEVLDSAPKIARHRGRLPAAVGALYEAVGDRSHAEYYERVKGVKIRSEDPGIIRLTPMEGGREELYDAAEDLPGNVEASQLGAGVLGALGGARPEAREYVAGMTPVMGERLVHVDLRAGKLIVLSHFASEGAWCVAGSWLMGDSAILDADVGDQALGEVVAKALEDSLVTMEIGADRLEPPGRVLSTRLGIDSWEEYLQGNRKVEILGASPFAITVTPMRNSGEGFARIDQAAEDISANPTPAELGAAVRHALKRTV
jgi:hypothetical protein